MLSDMDVDSLRTRIESLLMEIEYAPVECDGHSRMVAYVLNRHGIRYQIYCGKVRTPAGIIPLHFWVEVQGLVIDYRARMWLGQDAPHGVFLPSLGMHYDGLYVNQPVLSKAVFEILCTRISAPRLATAFPAV